VADASNSSLAASAALHYGRGLRRFLSVHLRNVQDAADLAQEVYLRLLRVSKWELIRNPEAYVITVASHVVSQYLLQQGANAPLLDIIEAEGMAELVSSEGENPAARAENMERFQKILAGLPPRVGAALVLHRIYGYTVQETADQLGVTRETAKAYLADAVRRCRITEYGGREDE
jgi:RNA polymerase sigma-19 factor, ECF subfamily